MPIDRAMVDGLSLTDQPVHQTAAASILYALGTGFGRDPLDGRERRFVHERDLVALPTLAAQLTFAGHVLLERIGADMRLVVHAGQGVALHRPLPPEGHLLFDTIVTGIIDKGAGRGALVLLETHLRERTGGGLLAVATSTAFARGDGGCGSAGRDRAPPLFPAPPARPPDHVDIFHTRPDQALLFRLSGDMNPLHADPEAARAAGFDRPILHGLCTYGICGRAVLASVLDFDATRLRALHVRFAHPVFPGETIMTEMWVEEGRVLLRAHVRERAVAVISGGYALI
ncbi:MaoC/PaaZ C-terminal domain-containing protein [Niveispirillum fermenti]|uniref:MaoC/PaaZ C-terminal domain-containing protein n=1 Tax=Niveispirillum fermenti TaxID=1233113 RepID=UPI003A85AE84